MLSRLISGILALGCIALAFALLRADRPTTTVAPAIVPGNLPATRPAEDAGLDRRIKEVRFDKVGLSDVIDFLSQLTRVNIYVDWQSLEGAGIDRAAPVQMTLHNVTLAAVLTAIETQVGSKNARLAHHAAGGIICISTAEEDARDVAIELYDVRELLDEMAAAQIATMKKLGLAPPADIWNERLDRLIRLIGDSVVPETWRDAGGMIGSIYDAGGILVITQTPENQRKVAELLGRIHQMLKRHEPLPTTLPAATKPNG